MEALFRKILCPIDFDRISIPALAFARDLARQNDATVYLLYVVSKRRSAPVEPGVEQFARDNLRAVARKWFEGKVRYEIAVRAGKPAVTVLTAAGELDVDLIVMATHGRIGRARGQLGSVTEQVVRQSTCPVMTIRPLPSDKPSESIKTYLE
jgi:nucleotide-binding universal stress UspA family protein